MSEPVRIKVAKQAHPDLRKLARALLILAAENSAKPEALPGPQPASKAKPRKAS